MKMMNDEVSEDFWQLGMWTFQTLLYKNLDWKIIELQEHIRLTRAPKTTR